MLCPVTRPSMAGAGDRRVEIASRARLARAPKLINPGARTFLCAASSRRQQIHASITRRNDLVGTSIDRVRISMEVGGDRDANLGS